MVGRFRMLMARERGAFLLQVLVVLAIIAILAGIAIPMMGSVMTRQDLDNAQETMIQALQKAKWLARARGSIVGVRVSAGEHVIALYSTDGSIDERIVLPARATVSEAINLSILPTGEISLPANANEMTITLRPPFDGVAAKDSEDRTMTPGTVRAVRVSTLGVVAGL